MDGVGASGGDQRVATELRQRLAAAGPGRLADAVRLITDHAFDILATFRPTAEELEALVQFLTDVGYATDARRQEWVLLADVFGLSDGIVRAAGEDRPGLTPSALPGPFYRADVPRLPLGTDICRDGQGTPLHVVGRVAGPTGAPVPDADVEVWHANAAGRYENQDPDNQPEFNLRGRFLTDAEGSFWFNTIRPGGYALPADGPVGALAQRLGLALDRPAHIHFAVSAPGYRRLVTAVFDGSDPAIERDALFVARPGMIGAFRSKNGALVLDVALALARDESAPHHPLKEGVA